MFVCFTNIQNKYLYIDTFEPILVYVCVCVCVCVCVQPGKVENYSEKNENKKTLLLSWSSPKIIQSFFDTLTSFKLHHSFGSGLVKDSVTTFLTSDWLFWRECEVDSTLGTHVLHTVILDGLNTTGGITQVCCSWWNKTFS